MNEARYKKKIDFQQKMILKQSEKIESLSAENARLRLEIEKKEELINSIAHLREELIVKISEINNQKSEYQKLIQKLKNMIKIINQEVYKGRWDLVKFLIK